MNFGINRDLALEAAIQASRLRNTFQISLKDSLCVYDLAERSWKLHDCKPEEFFVVAGWLGVGYTTLIDHLQYGLKLLPAEKARAMRKIKPKQLRERMFKEAAGGNYIVADRSWRGRPLAGC